jgi:hypothetical protein
MVGPVADTKEGLHGRMDETFYLLHHRPDIFTRPPKQPLNIYLRTIYCTVKERYIGRADSSGLWSDVKAS